MSEVHVADAVANAEPTTRVCPKCAAQSQVTGEFCPHCGARYAGKRLSRRAKVAILGILIALLVAGGAVAAVLIVHHNNQVAAHNRAVHHAAVLAAAKRRAAAAAAAAQRKIQKAEALVKRDEAQIARQGLVSALQGAVKSDAEKDVASGVLNGPILRVQCQPATAIDASASIANYTCLAANKISNGLLSGYRFSATINTTTGSYTWHLGG